jgi:hypothetical protein
MDRWLRVPAGVHLLRSALQARSGQALAPRIQASVIGSEVAKADQLELRIGAARRDAVRRAASGGSDSIGRVLPRMLPILIKDSLHPQHSSLTLPVRRHRCRKGQVLLLGSHLGPLRRQEWGQLRRESRACDGQRQRIPRSTGALE